MDHSIQRAGNLFSVAFGTSAHGVHNYSDAQEQDVFRYAPFFHSMLDSGVYLPPSVFEAWFLSAAHDDAAMNRIFDALPAAAQGGRRSEGLTRRRPSWCRPPGRPGGNKKLRTREAGAGVFCRLPV